MRVLQNGYILLLLLVVAALGVAGCVKQELVGEKITFNPSAQPELQQNQARLVFYRKKQDAKHKGNHPKLLFDGRVAGILSPNQYVVNDVCMGEGLFTLQQQNKRKTRVPQYAYDAGSQNTLYYRIRSTDEGWYEVLAVPEEKALRDLQQIQYTSFLTNRSNRSSEYCDVHAPTSITQAQGSTGASTHVDAASSAAPKNSAVNQSQEPRLIHESAFDTDILFRFDSAVLVRNVGSHSVEVFQALDEMATALNRQGTHVQKVRVVGHTDRLGAKAYNKALSERRAKAVANYFTAKGVKQKLEIMGMGAEQPVTTACEGSRATVELIQCLQPDRRVEVELWGT